MRVKVWNITVCTLLVPLGDSALGVVALSVTKLG
jgi:hypothetical protein